MVTAIILIWNIWKYMSVNKLWALFYDIQKDRSQPLRTFETTRDHPTELKPSIINSFRNCYINNLTGRNTWGLVLSLIYLTRKKMFTAWLYLAWYKIFLIPFHSTCFPSNHLPTWTNSKKTWITAFWFFVFVIPELTYTGLRDVKLGTLDFR